MAAETASDLISVIIPLYNGSAHIAETLADVLGQTHADLEVIVIDDGSSDQGAGAAIVTSLLDDPRLRLVRQENQGIARTRNVGLRLANPRARCVMVMDHDDRVDTTLILSLKARLAARPDAAAAFAIADYIDSAGEPLHPGFFAAFMRDRSRAIAGRIQKIPPHADATLTELFLANHIYPPSGVLIRRDALDAIGGFDDSYRVADDWDALVRLSRIGPIVPIDEQLVGYRRHAHNASGNRSLNIRETRQVWARTYYSPRNSDSQRQALREAWLALQQQKFHEKSRLAGRALRERRPLGAARLQLDALAHLALRRPLRQWMRSER